MLDLQHDLRGPTSTVKTPGPKGSPESRRPFNLRQSPDQWGSKLLVVIF